MLLLSYDWGVAVVSCASTILDVQWLRSKDRHAVSKRAVSNPQSPETHLWRLFFCLRGGRSVEGIVWQEHGLITLCPKNWPKFPPMPEVAGLYRITLNDGRVYIGEAQSLKRRLYEYRRPTLGIEQEHRVHAAIVATTGGKIDIYTQGDLSTRAKRVELERTEIQYAVNQGMHLVNDMGANDVTAIKAKITFHEQEAERWKAKLHDK